MKYKFYPIPALFPEQAKAELNQFCSQHHVLKTEREFVADGSNSFWSICVMYSNNSVTPFTGNEGRKNRVDYKEILSKAIGTLVGQAGTFPNACWMADLI